MHLFALHGWKRTLLLATVLVIGSVCVSNGQTRPQELVGHWKYYDGVTYGHPEDIELFADGTGVVDKLSIKWKVENKRLVLLSELFGEACNYKVSDYKLVLTYDDDNSATFLNKEAEQRAEEKKKKDAEQKHKEAESRIEKLSSYFTDSRNGQKYRSIKIGGKTWMAQNLNYQTGKSWCYGDNNSNCEKYGRLYDWNTAKTVCPTGWHLPSQQEWNNLVAVAGGDVAGKALKSTYGWDNYGNGTEDYGFSALPSGYRNTDGGFSGVGKDGYWWTATEGGSGNAYDRYVSYDNNNVREDNDVKGYGFSVRCLKD